MTSRSNVRLSVKGFIDRRSEDLHARHDVIEAKRFALRVERNHKERDRRRRVYPLLAAAPTVTSRQAD